MCFIVQFVLGICFCSVIRLCVHFPKYFDSRIRYNWLFFYVLDILFVGPVVCHLLWLIGSLIKSSACSLYAAAGFILLQLLTYRFSSFPFSFYVPFGIYSDTASMAWWKRRMSFGRIKKYRRWALPRNGICWRWNVVMWRAHGGKATLSFVIIITVSLKTTVIVANGQHVCLPGWQFVVFSRRSFLCQHSQSMCIDFETEYLKICYPACCSFVCVEQKMHLWRNFIPNKVIRPYPLAGCTFAFCFLRKSWHFHPHATLCLSHNRT